MFRPRGPVHPLYRRVGCWQDRKHQEGNLLRKLPLAFHLPLFPPGDPVPGLRGRLEAQGGPEPPAHLRKSPSLLLHLDKPQTSQGCSWPNIPPQSTLPPCKTTRLIHSLFTTQNPMKLYDFSNGAVLAMAVMGLFHRPSPSSQ